MDVEYLLLALAALLNLASGVYVVTGSPPTFAPLPSTVYTSPGSTLQLNCSASGSPVPTVTWYRIQSASPLNTTNGSLVILSVTDGVDSSSTGVQYQCNATNSFGTIISKPVNVITTTLGSFQGPASITYFVENTTISANYDDVALYCNISGGNTPLNIVWVDEKNQIVTNGVSSIYIYGGLYLLLPGIPPSMLITKTYHCRVTFPGTNVALDNSTCYNFSISGYWTTQPYFYIPLQNIVAYAGDANILIPVVAAATGQTAYSFQIYSSPPNSQFTANNAVPLLSLSGQSVKQVATISGPVSVKDSGVIIQCTISYMAVLRPTATLTVLASPMLISSPNNSLYNFQGDSASFTCAYNVAMGITLSWYMNGALLTNTSHVQISGSSLSVSALYANDSGMYQCSVSNGTNSVWGQWAVNVRVPQLVVMSPGLNTPLVVPPGNSATLIFQVQADPPPSGVQWYFNGSLIQNNNVYQISNIIAADNSTGSILYNTSLVIDSVDPTTQGYYFVSFSNRDGVSNTTSVFVTPPVNASIVSFTASPPCVTLGSTIQLVCTTYGYPIPTVTFLVLNSPVPLNEHFSQILNILTITNITTMDLQTYSCQIAGGVKVNLSLFTCPTLAGQPSGPVPVGGSVTLTCQTSSTNITWYKNGVSINNTGPSFTLSAAQTTDSGTYWCSESGINSNNVTISVVGGACQANGQPCPAQICPNAAVQLTCNIPSDKLVSVTRWMTSSPSCTLDLDQLAVVSCSTQPPVQCPPFTAANTQTNPNLPCNTSTLSFMMSPNLNRTVITCATTTVPGIIASTTLYTVAPPGPPSVSVVPGLNGLVVMWTSYGGGPAYYNITLVGAGISNSTNLTSTQFAGLPSDTLFSIAVVAINCAGYATTYVKTATLPLPPKNIRVQQVLLDTITQLTITWTAVGGNVTGYQIMSSSGGYNVTASPLAKDSCLGSDCVYNQNVKTTGALYAVTMASINGGGVGPWSDSVQGTGATYQQTSAISVGVGVGIGLGVPIVIIAVTMAMLFYWLYSYHRRSEDIYVPGPPVQEEQLVTLELRLYATQWHKKPPGYESYCSPMYITSQLNGCVLELKDNPTPDGHHVVISRRGLPPHDNQQWYLIDQSDDGTFLIVSKLNGKVLSCESGEKPSKDSVLWKKVGGHIRSVARENYVLGISGGHREPGYPVVLCGMKKDDMSQMFDERPGIVPIHYIECQEKCKKASHDSCAECVRCVQITDTAIVMGAPYTPQSTDAQRWYIEYLHGQLDGSFLIISKLNGKALYCKGGVGEGLEVKAAERNDEDESQHWKRDGSYIVSKTLNMVFFSLPRTHLLLLVLNDKNDAAAYRTPENKDRVTFAIKNCSTYYYIQHHNDDLVLDLVHEANGSVSKANGAAAVFNPKAAPPTDSQQWYLHPLSNGHYLVASWLHGKVLTYQDDGGGHTKCFVSNSNGGEDQMWKKEEDGSIVSVKYHYVVGRCVNITVHDVINYDYYDYVVGTCVDITEDDL